MDTISYKTRSANNEIIVKDWLLIDAEKEIVGRLASKVAILLRGKNKTYYTPNLNCGDNVIIINAEKVQFTGKKLTDKMYVRHTGYPGGQRLTTPRQYLAKKPEKILELAIRGMLPKNKLGDDMYKHLFVYAGSEHPHEAQKPNKININTIK
ncbi:MAG TPA: 50S ribosomal protein L13 [Bacteroidales bacterium]|nr:50S ribosomal protein L13 [Bacteroidales bacterium]HNZ43312.1 50S ribosomal protein L13 [Bacteroidales bacterium]HPB25305.1 50S ribosomal protein L13 [Bacteroidales bacterium]HPI29226.1 50S ribosomal protein L13 [Bacteroidales bacterium]HQN15141.1 50S ribosomal protein L13 [Bacteroidales bacterium]